MPTESVHDPPRRARITKAEVEIVALYRVIASTDKLIEALAFPAITPPLYDLIATELDFRLRRFNRDQPNSVVR